MFYVLGNLAIKNESAQTFFMVTLLMIMEFGWPLFQSVLLLLIGKKLLKFVNISVVIASFVVLKASGYVVLMAAFKLFIDVDIPNSISHTTYYFIAHLTLYVLLMILIGWVVLGWDKKYKTHLPKEEQDESHKHEKI